MDRVTYFTQKISFLMLIAFPLFFANACSGDDPTIVSPQGVGGQAGNSGIGGSGGFDGSIGSGGTGGSGGQAGSGGSTQTIWPKGQKGTVDKTTFLTKNGGRLQGVSVQPKMQKTMDLPGDAGADVDDEAGTPTPDTSTTPTVDLSGITPGFTEMWIPITPYLDQDGTAVHLPLVMIVKSDGTSSAIQHFSLDETNQEFSIGSWSVGTTVINGKTFGNFVGLSVDLVECGGGHYFVSNGGDKVWSLKDDGGKSVVASGLTGPSSVLCHPDGYLLVTTTPIWEYFCPDSGACYTGDLKTPTTVVKIPLDAEAGTPSVLATMPPDVAFDKSQIFFGNTNFVKDLFPFGWSSPIALRADKTLLVGNQTAKAIYSVSADGLTVSKFADMPTLAASAILAPNEVVYLVSTVLTDSIGSKVTVKPSVQAYDANGWSTMVEIEGYDQHLNDLSALFMSAPCSTNDAGSQMCGLPLGINTKIAFDSENNLLVIDPVNGTIVAYHLVFPAGVDASAD